MKLEDEILTSRFASETQKAAFNILFTAYWIKTRLNSNLKLFGFTHEQFNVARILKGKHPERMCVKDIARRMIEKNSNVPRILDRLVAKKIVTRTQSEFDKRETLVSLTKEGIELIEQTSKHMADKFPMLMNIDESTSLELNSILENLRNG